MPRMKRKVLVMISPVSAARMAGVARYAREHNWHLMIQDIAERNFQNIAWFSTGWGNVHSLRYRGLAERSPAAKWVAEDSPHKPV